MGNVKIKKAPIVQGKERPPPKRQIQVRVLVGAPEPDFWAAELRLGKSGDIVCPIYPPGRAQQKRKLP